MLAIRLPHEIESRLAALSKRTGRTKTHYAREAILAYLDDLEDFYLAEERMKRYDESRTVPLEDVLRRHGMAR
jgi:RHH-type transcriptional regulator, rel operon repressor / antitoxin RelB